MIFHILLNKIYRKQNEELKGNIRMKNLQGNLKLLDLSVMSRNESRIGLASLLSVTLGKTGLH